MPGVDFESVRSQIPIAQVLELVAFEVKSRTGDQVRGACPLHRSSEPRSRSFSANLKTNRFRCFKCGRSGGQLELWASHRGCTVYEAALDLCSRLGVAVPWIRHPRRLD
jgi:DNA primase